MGKAQSKSFTRRAFSSSTIAGGAAFLLAGAEDKLTITQASVPGDPGAPKPQQGTVPETLPFSRPLNFTRETMPMKASPFSMKDVRLLPGPFADAQEANRKLLHRMPLDRLLHTFKINAGIASSAAPLGGWEKPDCEVRGHFVGHFLSACALTYASTGDAELKSKGDAIVAVFADCQKRLGGEYLSAFPLEFFHRLRQRKSVWAPFYTIHKIMAGLLDMYNHCENRQALQVLIGMAAWTDKWTSSLTDAEMQMVLDTEYGGMNDILYALAAATNEPKYTQVGDRFTKKRFFDPLALRRDELRGLHTNTHIPQVIGAARRYEISGDQRFRDVADYFWQEVVSTRTYATGGTSNNEGWLVGPNELAQELRLGADTNECCCAYNMLKLSRMLYTWTADPRYFDYYERVLYNHRLGTIDLDDGTTQYYLGIVPGSWRSFGTEYDSFWCCNGTGVEEYSKLNDSIYFHLRNDLYVNLFIPSELVWGAQGVRIRQTNKFPQTPATEFLIKVDQPKRFALHLRIPHWVSEVPTLKINGVATEVSSSPGSYVTILRTWKDSDRVELSLPMNIYSESMADDHSLQAMFFGPLVLAGKVGDAVVGPDLTSGKMGPDFKKQPSATIPSFSSGGRPTEEWIRHAGAPLMFTAAGSDGPVELQPFYQLKKGQRYSIYWQVS